MRGFGTVIADEQWVTTPDVGKTYIYFEKAGGSYEL
jgi:hypothetical protein